jgi:hypothetical protein
MKPATRRLVLAAALFAGCGMAALLVAAVRQNASRA